MSVAGLCESRFVWMQSHLLRPSYDVASQIFLEASLDNVDGVVMTLRKLLLHLQGQGHQAAVFGPHCGFVGCCFGIGVPALIDHQTDLNGHSIHGTAALNFSFFPGIKIPLLSPCFMQAFRDFRPDVVHFVDPLCLAAQALLFIKIIRPHLPIVSSYNTNFAV